MRSVELERALQALDLRKLCCAIRKVESLNRALKKLDAWMTGLRRDQAVTRAMPLKPYLRLTPQPK